MKVGNRKREEVLKYQNLLQDILKAQEIFYTETGVMADYVELTSKQYSILDKYMPVSTWKFDTKDGELKPKVAGLDVVIKD